jgi:hypothetical protein
VEASSSVYYAEVCIVRRDDSTGLLGESRETGWRATTIVFFFLKEKMKFFVGGAAQLSQIQIILWIIVRVQHRLLPCLRFSAPSTYNLSD